MAIMLEDKLKKKKKQNISRYKLNVVLLFLWLIKMKKKFIKLII